MTFVAEAGGHSDSGGDSADRDSTRLAPTVCLASEATTVDASQPNTGVIGAGGSSPVVHMQVVVIVVEVRVLVVLLVLLRSAQILLVVKEDSCSS